MTNDEPPCCAHCGEPRRLFRRGICQRCHRDPAVRALAPFHGREPGTPPPIPMTIIKALEASGPLPHPDLVIACWKLDPRGFGLKDHESSHPDSNKVSANLYGRKRLIQRGLVVKGPDGRFGLTEAGLEVARKDRLPKKPRTPPPVPRPDREDLTEAELDALEAHQRANLPDWWEDDVEKEQARKVEIVVVKTKRTRAG